MQYLDVISINIPNILISLFNLTILFFAFKKFLFKPVHKLFREREDALASKFEKADEDMKTAEENRLLWEEKLKDAKSEANEIIKNATDIAKKRAEAIVDDAKASAEQITKNAEEQISLERQNAEDDIKREIVDVSVILTEKMLSRKLNDSDHRKIIGEFINEIGENDGTNK